MACVRVAVGRHVNAAYRVCDGMRQHEIVRVGKNSGPLLSRLWTKVQEILGQRRRPFVFVLSNALAWLSSFSRYASLRLEVVEKTNKYKSFWPPIFSGGMTPTFLWHIVSRFTVYQSLVEFIVCEVCLRSLADNEVECGIYGGWV